MFKIGDIVTVININGPRPEYAGKKFEVAKVDIAKTSVHCHALEPAAEYDMCLIEQMRKKYPDGNWIFDFTEVIIDSKTHASKNKFLIANDTFTVHNIVNSKIDAVDLANKLVMNERGVNSYSVYALEKIGTIKGEAKIKVK